MYRIIRILIPPPNTMQVDTDGQYWKEPTAISEHDN